MWFARDSFHFVWKKMSGDLTLAADITFPEKGVEPHRKACLMVRQDLDAGSAYADAALHGDGLTSLQYREEHGGLTREIQSNVKAPRRLRLEKRGKYVSMSVAREGEDLRPAGGSFRLELSDPFYVGLAVCAHNDDLLETAQFTNVELAELSPRSSGTTIHSTLENRGHRVAGPPRGLARESAASKRRIGLETGLSSISIRMEESAGCRSPGAIPSSSRRGSQSGATTTTGFRPTASSSP
jgi:regulation of enolase protein 1 (concanavalin A-like superfamily)